MIKLKNRTILNDGTVICTEAAAVDILYQGNDLSGVILDNEQLVTEFNNANQRLDQDFETIFSSKTSNLQNIDWYSLWLTPKEYQNINVQEYCLSKCTTNVQRNRVILEIELFEQRNMIPVLRHLIWMVDHMRQNKILWGVGRGSSVASYILFLIGINRIDPLRFNLDIREFLK